MDWWRCTLLAWCAGSAAAAECSGQNDKHISAHLFQAMTLYACILANHEMLNSYGGISRPRFAQNDLFISNREKILCSRSFGFSNAQLVFVAASDNAQANPGIENKVEVVSISKWVRATLGSRQQHVVIALFTVFFASTSLTLLHFSCVWRHVTVWRHPASQIHTAAECTGTRQLEQWPWPC